MFQVLFFPYCFTVSNCESCWHLSKKLVGWEADMTHDGMRLCFIGIYILYYQRKIFKFFLFPDCIMTSELELWGPDWQHPQRSLQPRSQCEVDRKEKHHRQTPIWKTKYCDRTCSHGKQGDATSLLSGFRICSAALHTLFSIELAVRNRFNQLKWHCCRLAVKWKN